MKKRFISIAAVAAFFIAISVIGCFSTSKEVNSKEANLKETKEIIEYNPPYGKVILNHKKHAETYKVECLKCHHDWKSDQTSGKLCKDCHKAKTEGKAISAKEAFHKNCKGCHDELKKAGKSTGPTGCAQCHKKDRK